jgi:hypothetical protein
MPFVPMMVTKIWSIPCAIMYLYNVLLVQMVDMAQSTLKPMSSLGVFGNLTKIGDGC